METSRGQGRWRCGVARGRGRQMKYTPTWSNTSSTIYVIFRISAQACAVFFPLILVRSGSLGLRVVAADGL